MAGFTVATLRSSASLRSTSNIQPFFPPRQAKTLSEIERILEIQNFKNWIFQQFISKRSRTFKNCTETFENYTETFENCTQTCKNYTEIFEYFGSLLIVHSPSKN